ncbi:hypothetical protein Dimus_031780 [Dionaea muscipula]
MGKSFQKERIGPYRCRKGILCKDVVDSLKKKDIVKSKVRGVEIEFDHEKLATILVSPGTMGSREYVKDVWEESKYIKPLEITVRKWRERRRDNDGDAPEVEAEDKDEGNKDDFDWEAVIDEANVEGESGSGEKFYDAEEEAQGSPELPDEIPAEATPSSAQQKDKGIAGVDPSGPTGRELEFRNSSRLERKRANRFHDDLEKAKAENARLLALLHQAQTKSNH